MRQGDRKTGRDKVSHEGKERHTERPKDRGKRIRFIPIISNIPSNPKTVEYLGQVAADARING